MVTFAVGDAARGPFPDGTFDSGSPLRVHLLLGPAAPEIAGNTMRNLAEGRIAVIQAAFELM